VSLPHFYGLLTEILLAEGRLDEAETNLERAFVALRANKEGVSESTLWRIKGALLEARRPGDLAEAIACYRAAVDLPRASAATALHGALARRGRDGLLGSPLPGLLARYPAEITTPDLREARAALEAMPVR